MTTNKSGFRTIDIAFHMGRDESNKLLKRLGLKLEDFDGEAETDEISQEGKFSAFRKQFTSVEVAKGLDEKRAARAKEQGDKQAREGRGDDGTQTFGKNGLPNVVAPRLIPWLAANGYVAIALIRERKPAHYTDADVKKAKRDDRGDVRKGEVKRGRDGKSVTWKYATRLRYARWEDELDRPSSDLTLVGKIGIIIKDAVKAIVLAAIQQRLEAVMKESVWQFCHVWENPNGSATVNFTPMAQGCPNKQLTELFVNQLGSFVARTVANKDHPDYQPPAPRLTDQLKAKLGG